jgi:hypothetical protein
MLAWILLVTLIMVIYLGKMLDDNDHNYHKDDDYK